MLKAELVLYAFAKCFNEYDKAVIVSGDGDFGCLVEYLHQNDKLLALVCLNKRYSSLLRKCRGYINIIGNTRNKLEYKKARNSVRSKP